MGDWQASTGHVTRVAVIVGGDSPMPTRVTAMVGGQSVDTAASVACRPHHY